MPQSFAHWLPIIVSAVTALAVLGAGGLLTRIGPWYRSLTKPSWQPPDWLFAPAWTIIFVATGTAAVLAWENAATPAAAASVIALFVINYALNIAWSAFFFRFERPDLALIEVAFLWLSIVALMGGLMPISTTAGLLILPYLAWVSFAAFLNFTIVRLNPRRTQALAATAGRKAQ